MVSQFSISAEAAIDSLVRALHEWLIQLTWYVGCEVTDVSEVDAGWVTCRISGGTNQRCRWRKLFAIAVGDYVDVLYDPKSMTWEVFKPGGAAAWYSTGFNVDQDSIRFEYTNNSTGTLTLGEVVVFDSTQDLSVTTTTTLGDTTVAGAVVVGNVVGALVQVAQLGVAHVQVDGNVTRGQFLKTSTARGLAIPTNTEEEGVFGIALTANTAGSTGTVQAFLVGHSWDGAGAGGGTAIHTHAGAGQGGQLDWDNIWSDAVHSHANAGEGSQLDWDNIWSDAVHSHANAGEGGQLDWDDVWSDAAHDHSAAGEGGDVYSGAQGFFFKTDGTGPVSGWRRISTQTCTVGPGTTCEAATLGAAVGIVNAAGPPSAANPWVIKMYAGVFTEAGNITIPSYCWVEGEGEGTQINMGTGNDITFSADSGMESCYVYGVAPTAYLLGTAAGGVAWRNVRAYLSGSTGKMAFSIDGGSAEAELWHCIAEDASGTELGYWAGNGCVALLFDCIGNDMDGGIQTGTGTGDVVTTLYCEFLGNNTDIFVGNGTTWNHMQCSSLRNSINPDQDFARYTHWPNGEYLDMDFTGTDWNTKVECNYVGLRFSDVATPFPGNLTWPVSGTWAHSAGNGWQPTITVNAEGPAILIPIMRPGNWELFLDYEYTPGNVNERFWLALGYIANSNHYGAFAAVRDAWVGASDLQYHLYTNDGDDTGTAQYNGVVIAGAVGNYQIGFRAQNGCVGVYDDQNNSWNYFTGRQCTGASPYSTFTAAHAFLQFNRSDANVPTLRIRNLRLTYLL